MEYVDDDAQDIINIITVIFQNVWYVRPKIIKKTLCSKSKSWIHGLGLVFGIVQKWEYKFYKPEKVDNRTAILQLEIMKLRN